jgi:hypothetical protein
VTQDGVAYLRSVENRYDAIVVDVFGSNNTVPRCFTTQGLLRSVQRALSPSGIFVMNVITRDDRDKRAETIARRAQSVGMSVRLFDWLGEDNRNTLIAAGGAHHITLPSGREPEDVEEDMDGLTCRRLEKKRKTLARKRN